MLTLEVLRARHGDCLIIHHGSRRRPRRVLIDGGPHHVFKSFLKPRLEAMRDDADPEEPLPLELVMVSHLDQDHIYGILELFNALSDAVEDEATPLVDIGALWHNAFPDLVGKPPAEAAAAESAALQVAGAAEAEADLGLEGHTRLVLSSVNEGRKLRDAARKLAIEVNPGGSGGLILAGHEKKLGNLALQVIGPAQAEADALKKEWDKQVKVLLKKEAEKEKRAKAAAYVDKSVFNIASIVVVAEMDGRRMLLTGDARGDTILEGLEAHGLLDGDGKAHFDLLKLPHHGSDRNVEDDFFRRITADRYVVSGDGSHHNPELETFRMLFRARERETPFSLHLTYAPGEMEADYPSADLTALFAQAKADGVEFTLETPAAGSDSMSIPLVEAN